jgi:hypothetical protein
MMRLMLENPAITVDEIASRLIEMDLQLSRQTISTQRNLFRAILRFLHRQGYLNPARLKDQSGFFREKVFGLEALEPLPTERVKRSPVRKNPIDRGASTVKFETGLTVTIRGDHGLGGQGYYQRVLLGGAGRAAFVSSRCLCHRHLYWEARGPTSKDSSKELLRGHCHQPPADYRRYGEHARQS